MARSAEDILKHQIGDLMVQCSVLAAQNEALREELAKRPAPKVKPATAPPAPGAKG